MDKNLFANVLLFIGVGWGVWILISAHAAIRGIDETLLRIEKLLKAIREDSKPVDPETEYYSKLEP